jgi:hypothetical protein
MFAVIVAKWIILEFVPSSQLPVEKQVVQTTSTATETIPQEVTLSIDFSSLQRAIESQYNSAKTDIDRYTEEEISRQKQMSYAAFTKNSSSKKSLIFSNGNRMVTIY